jgi:hypothetical protein
MEGERLFAPIHRFGSFVCPKRNNGRFGDAFGVGGAIVLLGVARECGRLPCRRLCAEGTA